MPSLRGNELTIQTPEGIVFGLTLAGPFTRFLAWGIDIICIVLSAWVLTALLAVPALISPGFIFAFQIVATFALMVGYGMALEWFWRGQTVGKRVLRLRVVDELGLQLQFSQVAVRNLLRVADMLPILYLTGGITCFLTRHNQRLGDLAAGTVVTRSMPNFAPDTVQVLNGKYNSLRGYPHIEARLRQHVSPQEAALALQAVFRRDELDDDARVRLFREFADHFRTAADFPEEAQIGLTDEQYVRNVVDSLFNPRANPI